MIAPSNRPGAAPHTPEPPDPAADGPAPANAAPAGSAGGDGDSTEAQAALDARIDALVARATTPEDEALERQREEFDFVTRVRAETERELNALRDMAMEQMKQDDELLKKWIALI